MAKQPAKRTPKTPAATPARRTPAAKTTRAPKAAKPAAPARGRTKTKPEPQPVEAGPRSFHKTKFTLYNFLAKERAYYLVEPHDMARPAEDMPEKSVAHSIIVIDRSGSMYGSIEALKTNLLKLLTLDEYSRSDLLVTLISYSSQGDLTVHFQRTPVTDIMKPNSRFQAEIRGIRATALTCISQGVQLAASLVKDDELTAISVHSDGYANDPSSTSEARNLESLCEQLKPREAFVNTIAYTDYSDFRLLSRMANAASGACVRAGNIQQVYDSLYNTSKILEGSVAPPIEEPLQKGFDYQVFVSRKGGKINGAAGTLKIVGLRADDDAVVYRYKQLTRQEYDKLKDVPVEQTGEAVFAFARAQLAEGSLNTAKYALASTFDATLADKHSRALTNPQVADLAGDLETVLTNPYELSKHEVLDHVKVNNKVPLLQLVRILEEHKAGFVINLKHLQQNYARRGLRRVQGTRDENGKLVEPWLKTEFADDSTHVPISSFDVNRNTATLNVLISRRVKLVPREGGKPIAEVAGVKLDKLSTFNNYTVVSDGDLNVRTLQVKVSDPKLFTRLQAEGVLELDGTSAAKHDPDAEWTLRLEALPLVPPFEGEVKLDGLFNELAELKVLSSIVSAHLKEESAEYAPEQVEELKKHYLSKSLFLSFPTTTEYTDLKEALANGSVDTRVSYKIDLGSREILNLGKLHSANKFLDRMYEMSVGGQKLDKPTFEQALADDVSYKHKQLSARTKVTAVDTFMKRLFDDFLGLANNGSATAVLAKVGAIKLVEALTARRKGAVKKADLVAALADGRGKLDAFADKLYQERVSPLVFYVGSTGLLPDEIDAKAQTAEALAAKYPELGFSKDEQDGTFFEIGDTILSVYAKNEYFSVGSPGTELEFAL